MNDLKYETAFTKQVGIAYPIICGPMYPCSNPELIAAVSEAGGIGIVQPLSMVYVHGYELSKGFCMIKEMTKKPFGMNVIVESSSRIYENRMRKCVETALKDGCRFFITSLGSPKWVVEMIKPFGAILYHDVTSKHWAEKALDCGVDGFICVNNRAGGHAGTLSPEEFFNQLQPLGLPLICAGGIGDENDFVNALKIGYAGVQMGTRFIATTECHERGAYKSAIVNAGAKDIILTERVTGIPLSVIRTAYVDKIGTKIGPLSRLLFKYRWTKKWMRIWYGFLAMRQFKKLSLFGDTSKEYWQAGKSVEHIYKIEPVASIISRFIAAIKEVR